MGVLPVNFIIICMIYSNKFVKTFCDFIYCIGSKILLSLAVFPFSESCGLVRYLYEPCVLSHTHRDLPYLGHWGGGCLEWVIHTVRCCYDAVNFLQNTHKRYPKSGYGVSLVRTPSDLWNVWATAVLYEISCYIGPRYNGTRLYKTGPFI